MVQVVETSTPWCDDPGCWNISPWKKRIHVSYMVNAIIVDDLAMQGAMVQNWFLPHYNDVIMGVIASQITSLTIVYSIVYSDADQRKYQSSESLAFVRGIHRGPANSPHKWPITRKMFPFDDVIMIIFWCQYRKGENVEQMPNWPLIAGNINIKMEPL